MLIATVMLICIGSREYVHLVHIIWSNHLGYSIWAFSLYFLIRIIFARQKIVINMTATFTLSLLVEISQLIETPFLNKIRENYVGGLIIGFGWHATDLLAYLAGILLAASADYLIIRNKQ